MSSLSLPLQISSCSFTTPLHTDPNGQFIERVERLEPAVYYGRKRPSRKQELKRKPSRISDDDCNNHNEDSDSTVPFFPNPPLLTRQSNCYHQ